MKKFSYLILASLVSFFVTGCGSNVPTSSIEVNQEASPDVVVKNFMEAMKECDFETMAHYTNDMAFSYEFADSNAYNLAIINYYKDCLSKLTYDITDTVIDGEEATVMLNVTHIDSAAVLSLINENDLISDINTKDLNEEEIQKLKAQAFNLKINEIDETYMTTSFTIDCIQIDNEWTIKAISNDNFMTIITSNLNNLTQFN